MAENTPQRHLARMDNTEVADAEDDGYDVNARENIDSPQKGRARISQVSRPPSSHITRVDEEPTGSDGRRSGAPLVETVDRGVGPTPRPPPPPPGAALEPTLSSYFSFQPFPAARNDLLEAYGIPYVYSHLPHSVNTPLPINPSTLEGRYHWPPTSPFHRHFHGMPPSPIPADISLLNMRCPTLPVDNPVTQLASRLRFDQLQRSYYSPLSSRRFSPASLPGLPFGTGPFLVDYPPPPSISGRSLFSDFQPTPGSGSITLPGSLESSRLTSPRASIVGGKSRKRALSHSPLSDFLDIQSLTRSSEGSLQLASFLQHSSRSSSAASGSYGHLSVASVGAPSPSHAGAPPHPYLQAGCWGPPTLFYPLLGGHPPPVGHMVPPSIHVPKTLPKSDPQAQISTTTKESGSSSVVSSSRAASRELHKAKFKRDTGNLNIVTVEPDDEDEDFAERRCSAPQEETDIAETNCHWVDCSRDFQSQDDLVTHINQDHIQSNKKSFVCRWRECSREEKPFKAQYMLVVHMRRHTGEKPHRCTFEGCNKAYSRLENLKTHLRSHTGEKPYMCEFPGCTKAFSNASDRAKHQNRTHSNAKPYVCKAVGCSKRYTDPSSLRKHVKTVHGADFYANKKHKGDASCHLKKEGSNGDHKFCETSRQGEGHIQSSRPLFQVSGNGRQSQDNIGSAPSSHSHPSPESSPEVNVICDCEPGQSYLTDDHNVYSGGLIRTTGVEDQDVLMAESSDAEVATLSSPHHVTTGTSNNVGDRLIQLSVTKLLQGSPVKGSTEHDSISYSAREKSHIHNGDACRTLLPTSRRESSSSTLSSYMSSMRSMGSTFSSRRSSGTSPFSSRRSSGTSARLSIANSPYEYDINGNLPNCVSRRSSGESSTNVSRMMQKTHIGNQHCLPTPPVAGVVKSGGGVCNGMDNKAGNKCYNERLARYFSSWPTIDGSPTKQNLNEMFTSTPRQTPLPRGFPDQEIRRASDPVRFHDSSAASQKHLHRFHSLSVMQPLPIPDSMQSLRDKKGRTTDIVDNNNEASVNTFSSSRTHVDMYDNLVGSDSNSNVIKDDIDRNIFQDGEDLITLDDMRVFLNECLGGGMSLQEYVGEISPNDLPVQQKLELNIDACDLEPVDSVSLLLSPCLENGDVVGDYNVENVENGDSVEGNLLLYTDLPDFCQSLLANRSSVEEDFRQLSPTFENLALVDGIKIEPELLLNDCQEGRYDAYPVEADELARSDGSLQQINGSVQNHVQLYLNGHGDYNNASLPEQGGLVSSSTARKSEEYQSMSYKSKEVSRQKARVGRNVSGHDSMPEYGRSSNDLASITVQESHKPRSRNSLTCLASQEARSGFGACSPQHSSQHHQLQQQPHTVSTLSALPSYPYLNNHHHHDNDHKMLPSPSNVGNFLPTPPVGSKPSILRQKRFSPQLQVPHISQSQIPANDKATSQAQLLLKQQQDQQHRGQQNPDTHADPSLSSHVPQLQETFSATKYHNQKLLSRDLHQLYSQNLQKLSPSEPSHRNTGSGAHTNHLRNGGHYNDTMHIPTSDQARSRNYSMSQSITPATVHPVNPLRNDNLNTETRDIYHTNQIPCRSASKAQNAIMSSVNLTNHFTNDSQHNMTNNISTSGQSSSKSPNTTLASADPQNINNIHASLFRNIHPQASSLSNHPPDVPSNSSNTCNPTEMSPGCHQVTSSTDCKDTTAMLIDDFMDTFSSISLENMIENIPYSPAPMSVRSASRNSGHYSALMSTSNMVVNDMCSVLTQLAEENKYLSMRP